MGKKTKIAQPKDVPVELIQRIQSLLPFKEDVRTCILSKSWLHAWSTIPTLKFLLLDPRKFHLTYENETNYINRTLQRYLRENTPIESFHLKLSITEKNQEELVSLAKTWIQQVVSKSCLKELKIESFTYKRPTISPNKPCCSQDKNTRRHYDHQLYPIKICTNPLIKCVSLRVLELQDVIITEEVLHNLLFTCSLLEKIKILCCKGFKNVKVKNLLRLNQLDISTKAYPGNIINLEINNVPSLRSFCYLSLMRYWWEHMPFQRDSLTSVTQLHIDGVFINDLFFDIVKSEFPFLESLILGFGNWGPENMIITSPSLKWLTLKVLVTTVSTYGPVNIQVNAPRLLCFKYDGVLIPGLTFPTIAPEQIKLTLRLREPMDCSYLLKLRKALNLLSKFDINIIHDEKYALVSWNIDVDDLRRRVSVSITDVHLSLTTHNHWSYSRFFDAFFSICRPSYIKCVKPEDDERENERSKDVMVKNPCNGKWKTLRSSWESVLGLKREFHIELPNPEKRLTGHYFECKLNWVP